MSRFGTSFGWRRIRRLRKLHRQRAVVGIKELQSRIDQLDPRQTKPPRKGCGAAQADDGARCLYQRRTIGLTDAHIEKDDFQAIGAHRELRITYKEAVACKFG